MEQSDYIRAVDTYADSLFRIACSYCRCRADAEDIVQNVFIKLYQRTAGFEDGEHMKRWLIRVTANEAKNLCTSFWKKNIVPLDSSEAIQLCEFPDPKSSDLYDAVTKLPYKYRIVVHLYYYEDYPIKEIADILQIKETAVQTRLMRARKRLKMKLKEDWQDDE